MGQLASDDQFEEDPGFLVVADVVWSIEVMPGKPSLEHWLWVTFRHAAGLSQSVARHPCRAELFFQLKILKLATSCL